MDISKIPLTPWYKWPLHPVREGWYDFRGFMIDEGERMYWNGQQWGYWRDFDRKLGWTQMADVATDEWRGLSKEPK